MFMYEQQRARLAHALFTNKMEYLDWLRKLALLFEYFNIIISIIR